MKKLLFVSLLSCISITAFANNCPPAKDIFVLRDHGFDVAPPPGWKVVIDKRAQRHRNFIFRVAAWGDHKHPTDAVRCHYYDHMESRDYIQIETTALYDKSHVEQWGGNDPLYDLCVSQSDNVYQCSFK